jgi:hypothetical protein
VFFCNGPQCAATPNAVRTLVGASYPATAILYYRGGMHDWIALGYATVPGSGCDAQFPRASSRKPTVRRS